MLQILSPSENGGSSLTSPLFGGFLALPRFVMLFGNESRLGWSRVEGFRSCGEERNPEHVYLQQNR